MSSTLGMIEWLDYTRPMKELVEESYSPAEQANLSLGKHPRKLYQDFVNNNFQKSKPSVKPNNFTILYAELFVQLDKKQIQDEFQRIQSIVPADLLRRSYYKISTSHEAFFTLRQQFISSYATLCTSHYILGIGDRHQSK